MPINITPIYVWLLAGAALLTPLNSLAQTETINTSLCGCQPGAGSPCPGNTNYIMCTFAINITSGCPSFTAINNFTTSGTYVAADILNFKLYETNFSVFNTSTLVATINTGLGPGAHSFTGFNRTTCAAAQRYYWITADFSATAVSGHTIKIDLITAGMYAITGTLTYGTNTAAGLQTICNPLPVELISFTGKHEDERNVLQWLTATETNNEYFTLERSTDGVAFTEMARVDGAGTSSMMNAYSVNDYRIAEAPVVYYRLRQTDYNGQFDYVGGIISVQAQPHDPVMISSVNNTLEVQQQEGELTYVIYDLTGRSCMTGTVSSGNSVINVEGLPAGTYIIRLNDKKQTVKRFSRISD